jgi:hypothetical protein
MKINNEEEESLKKVIVKFKENLKFLLYKWKLILIISLFSAGIGLVLALTSEKIYKSTLSLIVEEDGKSNSSIGNIASSIGIGGIGGQNGLFTTSNMLEYLKTRQLFEQALLSSCENENKVKTTFAELYLKSHNWREKWSKKNPHLAKIKFNYSEDRLSFSLQKDSVLGLIYKNLIDGQVDVSKPSDDNSVILINVKTNNEIFTKKFPEKLVEVVSDFYIKSKTEKAKKTVDILQRQVDSVRRELYSSLSQSLNSNDQIFGLNPALNSKKTTYAKNQIEVQTNNIILSELVKNLEISKMNLLNQTPLIQVIDKPLFPLDFDKLTLLKGVILGGFLGGLLIVIFLVFKRYIDNL